MDVAWRHHRIVRTNRERVPCPRADAIIGPGLGRMRPVRANQDSSAHAHRFRHPHPFLDIYPFSDAYANPRRNATGGQSRLRPHPRHPLPLHAAPRLPRCQSLLQPMCKARRKTQHQRQLLSQRLLKRQPHRLCPLPPQRPLQRRPSPPPSYRSRSQHPLHPLFLSPNFRV